MRNAVFKRQRSYQKALNLFLIFALLVSNAARGLASRLARGLALAAAAALYGFCDILGFDRLDSFHGTILLRNISLNFFMIITYQDEKVNILREKYRVNKKVMRKRQGADTLF